MKERNLRYGIRKCSIGVASIALGIVLLSTGQNQVHADEQSSETTNSELTTTTNPTSETKPESEKESYSASPALIPISESTALEEKKEANIPNEEKVDIETPSPTTTENSVKPQIEAGHLRLHFEKLPSDEPASLGLWTWDDVDVPSSQKGSWPTGATSFSEAKQDDYGYYLDVKLKEKQAKKVSFLINNTVGDNLTGDKNLELISPEMQEVWLDKNYAIHLARPIPDGFVRLHYTRTDGHYDKKSVWYWGDVKNAPTTWPDGVDFLKKDQYGVYLDIPLTDAANSFGFLLLDENKNGDDVKIQANDYKVNDLKKRRHIFVKDADPTIYTNPYFIKEVRLTGAQQISPTELELTFSNLDGVQADEIKKDLLIKDKSGILATIQKITLDEKLKKATLIGDFQPEQRPYTVSYGNESFQTTTSWQLKDSLYSYDGELGARLKENGSRADVTLWSPSADKVEILIYDRQHQDNLVATQTLEKGERGSWNTELKAKDFELDELTGYYYHYRITRGDQSVLVLDPYAKSLAAWNSDDANKGPAYQVAKAAFVDPSSYGPKDLDYAKIPHFKSREDAIIYEAHVRDFTSDKAISNELKHQFATFAAFAERLDYLKDLGVTHIQLLPVLSYYFVNELKNGERLDDYTSSNSNYNWGYDPQNYFSLTGMYSENPSNPGKRIEEFKQLVAAIHERGMGVILDVVYNHTAKTSIFEDLEPNYYHFMDADGTPRTSFGGGRLGTTHYMSRRVLVDSIAYLTKEFKVDGFRFDMMGDHDAESIEKAYHVARALNPNLIMLGEGWVTYAGDENNPVQPADQSFMKHTDTVAVFSDDIRNTLKSGYPNEGTPAFITGGKKDIKSLFSNIKAQPTNFEADNPGDVIQYIAAHDNLTLFDIIAQSIKKDPAKKENEAEIHRRLRLGNLLILTSQGTPFLHSGQEYGRTKQFRDPAYRYPVSEDKVPNKSHLLVNQDGTPFDYPYFIHDSYDSSDAINHFDWSKALHSSEYPENAKSRNYLKNLIALRKASDAFHLATKADVDERVRLITVPGQDGVEAEDLVLGYQVTATNGDQYIVLVNADSKTRTFNLAGIDLSKAKILADANQVSLSGILQTEGLSIEKQMVNLEALTATILYLKKDSSNQVIDETKNRPNQQHPISPSPSHIEASQMPKQQASSLLTTKQTPTKIEESLATKQTTSFQTLPKTGTKNQSLLSLATIIGLAGLQLLRRNRKTEK